MSAHEALIWRSADLKRGLLEFARGPRYRRAVQQAIEKRFGREVVVDEGDLANCLDYVILQHRLADGRTLVEHFVAAHPELPEAERTMLLGWRDVVEGIFAIQGRDGEALMVVCVVRRQQEHCLGQGQVDSGPVSHRPGGPSLVLAEQTGRQPSGLDD